MTIEELKKDPELEKEFRINSKKFAATEIGLITRYLNGENGLKGTFSDLNLEIIKSLTSKNIQP